MSLTQDLLKKSDPLFTRPAAWVGELLRHTRIFRRGQPREDHATAIVRPGGMGDLICATIAAEDLGLDPRSFFWVIERRSEPWARYLGLDYLAYDGKPRFRILAHRGQYRTVINTEQLFGLSQGVALLLKAREGSLVGFSSNRARGYADVCVPYDPKDAHEVAEFRKLLIRSIGATSSGKSLSVNLPRPRRNPAQGHRICCLAGLQSETRHLSKDSWLRLIRSWSGGREFQLSFAPIDTEFGEELLRHFRGQATPLSGCFRELCDKIAGADEVLTMDGGMTHVASYFGVPASVLFTSGREKKWAPLGQGSSLIRTSHLSCQPCTLFGQTPPCPNNLNCQKLDFNKHRIALD